MSMRNKRTTAVALNRITGRTTKVVVGSAVGTSVVALLFGPLVTLVLASILVVVLLYAESAGGSDRDVVDV